MMSKTSIVLSAAAVVLAATFAWFVVLQPAQVAEAVRDEGLLASGIRMFDDQQYEDAIAVLTGIPDGSPEAAQARYYQGSAYMMLKDYEAAAKYLEQARVLNPRDSGTLYALGVAYYRQGNLPLAKGYFAAVLEINPNDEQARGLMDIMARLERRSAPAAESE